MSAPPYKLKSSEALDRIRGRRVPSRASRGERVLGGLFPNRGTGFPGSWSGDRIEQVSHMRNWTYVAVNCIASKIASIVPNMAYVVDSPKPGLTTKACQRGLMNVTGRGFGGSPYSGGVVKALSSVYSPKSAYAHGDYAGMDFRGSDALPIGTSDGGHSFLTMGELRSKSLSVLKPHEDLEPLEADHPLRRLIENPNPFDTSFDLFYELQMFDELCGIDYLWAVPNDYGMPCELWCIPSHWVWPRTGGRIPDGGALGAGNRLMYRQHDFDQDIGDYARYGSRYLDVANNPDAERLIQYYEIRPWGGMGSAGVLRIPPGEMIVTRWKSPLNKIDGYSRLSAVAQWIDSEESISKSRWSQFSNIARPEFWVELGPGYEDPDDEKIERIEAKFMAKVQGEYAYGKPVITPPGTKISPLSFSPTEMAYFQCLHYNTECLTSNGWKKYDELTLDTEIACYDPVTESIVYAKPSAIHISDYSGIMYKWESQHIEMLMTPNHRCYVGRGKYKSSGRNTVGNTWSIIRADLLDDSTIYRIKHAAPVGGDTQENIVIDNFGSWRQREQREPHSITPEVWLKFLGHYISEGCLYSRKVGNGTNGWEIDICQSPDATDRSPLTFASIKDSVESMPYNWRTWKAQNGCIHWTVSDKRLFDKLMVECGAKAKQKHIPEYIKSWSSTYLKILLDALIDGDGSIKSRSASEWSAQYWTSSKQLADDVMEIAVKCGYRSQIAFRPDKRDEYLGTMRYVVNISTKSEQRLTPSVRSQVQYDGKVWCVTVPTGLFVVRTKTDSGYKEIITANSEDQIRDMILSAFQVPKSAVGISTESTYGSLLASLANMCQTCINPRLAMRGQVMSKHLACRWDEPGRKVRLWYDDTAPADPQQVNADMTVDGQFFALTPNEVRAIRGRRAYRAGGDDPMAPGPGGIMPIPMNTGQDASNIGHLISAYVTATQPEPPPPPPGMLPPGAEEEAPPPDDPNVGARPAEAPPGIGAPEMDGPPRGRGPGSEGPLEMSAHDMLADLGGIAEPNRRAQDHLLKSVTKAPYKRPPYDLYFASDIGPAMIHVPDPDTDEYAESGDFGGNFDVDKVRADAEANTRYWQENPPAKHLITKKSGPYYGQYFSDDSGEWKVTDISEYVSANGIDPVPMSVEMLAENNLQPTPYEEDDEKPGTPEFEARSDDVDLSYPIMAVSYPDGIWICDGVHRLDKARRLGLDTIDTYLIDRSDLDRIPHKPVTKGDRIKVRGRLVTKKQGSHSYSCVLVPLTDRRIVNALFRLQDIIDPADLYPEDGTDHGLERDPHVTVKYGLLTDDVSEVAGVLRGQSRFEAVLGLTSVFPDSGEGYDVLKVEVFSEGLHRMNALLESSLNHERTHPEYNPHLTVAYLRPGTGIRYTDIEVLAGQVFEIGKVVFSPATGDKSEIRLR